MCFDVLRCYPLSKADVAANDNNNNKKGRQHLSQLHLELCKYTFWWLHVFVRITKYKMNGSLMYCLHANVEDAKANMQQWIYQISE